MTIDERIAKVREFFTDKLSLRIFDKRVEIGKGIKKENFQELFDLVEFDPGEKERLLESIQKHIEGLLDPERETFIYGAGAGCISILCASGRELDVQGISGIIDNYVKGERYGLPIITFSEFKEKHKGALVFNSIGVPVGKVIHQQCADAGIDVISLFEFDRSWDQYFDLPAELGLVGQNEVFVQAGCYNGNTQKSYINWFGDTYEKLIAFEPNETQYEICSNIFRGFRDANLVKAGLSDKTGRVKFNLHLPGSSFISDTGTEEIETVSLDEYMGDRKVTFIALDIEGEEFKALKGAEKIIRTQKPKLAISVYHKPEDIYELPELIKSFRPDYKLYLRHYHLLDMAETVLYAL